MISKMDVEDEIELLYKAAIRLPKDLLGAVAERKEYERILSARQRVEGVPAALKYLKYLRGYVQMAIDVLENDVPPIYGCSEDMCTNDYERLSEEKQRQTTPQFEWFSVLRRLKAYKDEDSDTWRRMLRMD